MSRKLDPKLFGTQVPDEIRSQDLFGSLGTENVQHLKLNELEEKIERIRFELNEWLKTSNLKIERATAQSSILGQRFDEVFKEIREKLLYLASKMKEQKTTEAKIENLLTRHNQVIQNFELRLSQALRTIDEQNLIIQKQQSTIDENRKYLERLKRL